MKNLGLFKKKLQRSQYFLFRKYQYEDSGLACDMTRFKMKNYREKWDIIQEIEQKNKNTNIRTFPEFNFIEDRDIVISIEYW